MPADGTAGQMHAAGQAVARVNGKSPDVPAAAGRKGFKAELDALRDRMRGLGFGYDEIAAEIGRRYRARPREAYRLAWGWTLEQAAARFNDRAARAEADPQARASLTGSRLSEWEHWPRTGRKPSVYALVMLAEIYETGVRHAAPRPAGQQRMTRAPAAADHEHPLRRARRKRGLTLTALAGLAGLSESFLSMVETGQRPLRRRDHVNALALALRVAPAEIAPAVIPGLDEWAPAPPPARAFPPAGDDITVARHRELAGRLIGYVISGDTCAAGAWLRRMARDPDVNPWLLLDQLTMAGHAVAGPGVRPVRGQGAREFRRQRRTGAGWVTGQ
jgi:transcriptional regulator with XRE-family HTH domain